MFDRTVHFLLRMPFIFKFSKLCREQDKRLKILHDFTDQVIIQRRHELLTKSDMNQNEMDVDDVGIRKKFALLDVLLSSSVHGRPLTDLEIREEVDTFMFEASILSEIFELTHFDIHVFQGHDTTTSGITFCLFNIARHPEVQEKCFKEILDIIGDDKRAPTSLKQLNSLHYLELVIKESLRMFPSVAIIGRKVNEDIHLSMSLWI